MRNILFASVAGGLLLASSLTAGADSLTVGLLLNTDRAFDGYTLFTPIAEGSAYLIDMEGRRVHSWDKGTGGNATPYLLEDGSVIRVNRGITQHAWDGSLLWDFVVDGADFGGHHDIEVLPNGNVLLLVMEVIAEEEAIAQGRDPDAINTGRLESQKIIEVRKTGPATGEIVWEWRVWDHLIQDFDPTKENYGVVGEHPELVDINFGETNLGADHDWLHSNSLDYNPEFDQIAINHRQFGEFWVIDHSTTTEQAASHTGGRHGKGGDVLYRWGNPEAYRAGGPEDQQLFIQHDAQWIAPGLPGEGNMLIFSNGGIEAGFQSLILEIIPPVDSVGNYALTPGEAYGPPGPAWSYSDGTDFFSRIISGVGRLPNGNTLITSGVPGIIFEVTPEGETVWKYINPMEGTGPLTQGDAVDTTGFNGPRQVFRAYRYAPDYPGLVGRDLTPGAPLEVVFDADDDGIFDHEEEKTFGTDPFAADTDFDGLSDSEEIRTHGTDPLDADTDSDGFSDGDEVLIHGTDPLQATLPGDVNCDADVNSIDAALILQLTAGIVATVRCVEASDIDGDGSTTSIDAALVLQFSAGLLTRLPP